MKQYSENRIKVPRFCEENGFYTTEKRSKMMSKVRGKNTKMEVKLRKALWALGFRYRKNVRKLVGIPDIVFYKHRLVVFVDGEFWHGFDWEEKKRKLKTNRDFWIAKIERNIQRDQEVYQLLEEQGWTVLRFWEKRVKTDFEGCIKCIVDKIGDVDCPASRQG